MRSLVGTVVPDAASEPPIWPNRWCCGSQEAGAARPRSQRNGYAYVALFVTRLCFWALRKAVAKAFSVGLFGIKGRTMRQTGPTQLCLWPSTAAISRTSAPGGHFTSTRWRGAWLSRVLAVMGPAVAVAAAKRPRSSRTFGGTGPASSGLTQTGAAAPILFLFCWRPPHAWAALFSSVAACTFSISLGRQVSPPTPFRLSLSQ